jgi:hypothetical protein
MIEFLNANQGFVMVVLTLAYVVTTVLILWVSLKSHKEQLRPYVIVYLHSEENIVYLIIKNFGKTAARNVKINSIPELENPKYNPLKKSLSFENIIPHIPPDYNYKAFVDFYDNIKVKKYDFIIEYEGNLDKRKYRESYVSDLEFGAYFIFIKDKKEKSAIDKFMDKNHNKIQIIIDKLSLPK